MIGIRGAKYITELILKVFLAIDTALCPKDPV